MPMRRLHGYGEHRTWRHVERFWECCACGHKMPADGEPLLGDNRVQL
jgi:hypothetical protein